MADPIFVQEGESVEGFRASPPTGVKARFWRFHLHDETWLTAWGLLLAACAVGAVVLWLGTFLFRVGRIKAFLMGGVVCGAGAALILGGVFFGVLGMWGARYWMKRLPNRQLIPGVILSVKPLRILGLADLAKCDERKGVEFGLRSIEPWHLPSHSHDVGARIPCAAHYTDEGSDRYYFFAPYPIAHATGDEFDLEQCMARLGESPFQRLERLVARGLVPDHDQMMLVLDRNDEAIEERDALSASRRGQADRDAETRETKAV